MSTAGVWKQKALSDLLAVILIIELSLLAFLGNDEIGWYRANCTPGFINPGVFFCF